MSELYYQVRYALPWWLVTCLTNWMPENRITIRLRGALFALISGKCGRNLTLGRDTTLLALDKLTIGDDVYLARGTWMNAIGSVTIEDEVVTSPYVVIASSNHGFRDGSVRFGGAHPSPIKIGKGSWIGSHTTITAGVTIGPGNLIGANSVITHNTNANEFWGGVPAKRIGERSDNPSDMTVRLKSEQ